MKNQELIDLFNGAIEEREGDLAVVGNELINFDEFSDDEMHTVQRDILDAQKVKLNRRPMPLYFLRDSVLYSRVPMFGKYLPSELKRHDKDISLNGVSEKPTEDGKIERIERIEGDRKFVEKTIERDRTAEEQVEKAREIIMGKIDKIEKEGKGAELKRRVINLKKSIENLEQNKKDVEGLSSQSEEQKQVLIKRLDDSILVLMSELEDEYENFKNDLSKYRELGQREKISCLETIELLDECKKQADEGQKKHVESANKAINIINRLNRTKPKEDLTEGEKELLEAAEAEKKESEEVKKRFKETIDKISSHLGYVRKRLNGAEKILKKIENLEKITDPNFKNEKPASPDSEIISGEGGMDSEESEDGLASESEDLAGTESIDETGERRNPEILSEEEVEHLLRGDREKPAEDEIPRIEVSEEMWLNLGAGRSEEKASQEHESEFGGEKKEKTAEDIAFEEKINSCLNLDDLLEVIKEKGIIKGNSAEYTAEKIIEIIQSSRNIFKEYVQNGKITFDAITAKNIIFDGLTYNFGLREKVVDLVKKEVEVFIKNDGLVNGAEAEEVSAESTSGESAPKDPETKQPDSLNKVQEGAKKKEAIEEKAFSDKIKKCGKIDDLIELLKGNRLVHAENVIKNILNTKKSIEKFILMPDFNVNDINENYLLLKDITKRYGLSKKIAKLLKKEAEELLKKKNATDTANGGANTTEPEISTQGEVADKDAEEIQIETMDQSTEVKEGEVSPGDPSAEVAETIDGSISESSGTIAEKLKEAAAKKRAADAKEKEKKAEPASGNPDDGTKREKNKTRKMSSGEWIKLLFGKLANGNILKSKPGKKAIEELKKKGIKSAKNLDEKWAIAFFVEWHRAEGLINEKFTEEMTIENAKKKIEEHFSQKV